ncbi:hypothetical protein P7C70_g3683, partial [Phenoliferia sp. Uapishka_3]
MDANLPLKLPTEIWVEILASGGLTYYDFKRVARVSKTFQAIYEVHSTSAAFWGKANMVLCLQLPRFDGVLFRATPTELDPHTKVSLHPVISNHTEVTHSERTIYVSPNILYLDRGKRSGLFTLSCANEFITYPPIKFLSFDYLVDSGLYDLDVFAGTMEIRTGITVKDFWKKIRALFIAEERLSMAPGAALMCVTMCKMD